MPKLIDFSNFKNERSRRNNIPTADSGDDTRKAVSEEIVKEMVSILMMQKPDKVIFSLKEAAEILGIGQEFIRRRIKNGKIKALPLGDKQAINIVELARILSEGV